MSDQQQNPPPSSTLPFLVRFYDPTLHAPDAHNRTLSTILSWPDSMLESKHNYIQTLFPLPEYSPINPYAPIIDEVTFTHFRSNPSLRASLRQAFERMLTFYGLEPSSSSSVSTSTSSSSTPNYNIHPSATRFHLRARSWVTPFNHNHLRMTRIIRSLRVLGCPAEAEAFYRALRDVAERTGGRISERSLGFWERAARGGLNVPPDDERGDVGQGEVWLRGL